MIIIIWKSECDKLLPKFKNISWLFIDLTGFENIDNISIQQLNMSHAVWPDCQLINDFSGSPTVPNKLALLSLGYEVKSKNRNAENPLNHIITYATCYSRATRPLVSIYRWQAIRIVSIIFWTHRPDTININIMIIIVIVLASRTSNVRFHSRQGIGINQ